MRPHLLNKTIFPSMQIKAFSTNAITTSVNATFTMNAFGGHQFSNLLKEEIRKYQLNISSFVNLNFWIKPASHRVAWHWTARIAPFVHSAACLLWADFVASWCVQHTYHQCVSRNGHWRPSRGQPMTFKWSIMQHLLLGGLYKAEQYL